jgi:hypothetical protein
VRRTLHLPVRIPADAVSFDTLDEALAAIERFESRSPSGQGDARNSAPARFSPSGSVPFLHCLVDGD